MINVKRLLFDEPGNEEGDEKVRYRDEGDVFFLSWKKE